MGGCKCSRPGTYGELEDLLELSGETDDLLQIYGESTIPKVIQPTDISYNDITDKPSINNTVVQGDKFGIDYNLQDKMDVLTPQEIEKILYGFGI